MYFDNGTSTSFNRFIVEYVWIDGNQKLRGKSRIVENPDKDFDPYNLDKILGGLSDWNYDGSSTGQAFGCNSEVILRPQSIFYDPFRFTSDDSRPSYIVMCDTWDSKGDPHPTNTRYSANELFSKYESERPWFGLEQEYFLWDAKTKKPFNVKADEELPAQGNYYCGVGSENALGRHIVEEHFQACLDAGILISGINAEVAPGQWEFQIGPCEGIEEGDHLWIARYLLYRVCESYGMIPIFDVKPLKGEWNGSGCHMNFSTKNMRDGNKESNKDGIEYIYDAIRKLAPKHEEHMAVYGDGNNERMTGDCETSSMSVFTWGVADRTASVRIGNDTHSNRRGYLEDRRPGSTCDPYVITHKLCETIFE